MFVLILLYIGYLWMTLPDISDPKSLFAPQSTVITDRNGIELYRLFSEQDRTYVPGNRIPDAMKKAIISIEDKRFYDRGCLDIRAFARAAFHLGTGGGASTLTRQLARTALELKQENVLSRKLKEIVLGCEMESRFSKDQILELYLNWIPFGQNAYGIEQASERYFAASASGLTLAKSAVLASIPQRPTYFSPYGIHQHTTVTAAVYQDVLRGKITTAAQIPDVAVTIGLLGAYIGTGSTTVYIGGRTDQVLRNMQDQGFITEGQRLQALTEIDTLKFQPLRDQIRAAHFVLSVRDQLTDLLGTQTDKGLLEHGGLKVTTTLDWKMQEIAEKVVANHREDVLKRFGANNIALVALDPATRQVLAYVGNSDYSDVSNGGKIDMARAPRQPGSSFKPIVYAAAFQQGYTPATVLYDVPTKIGADQPMDYDGKYMGLMTIRQALGASRNIPAAKAFFLAGGEAPILQLASDLGAPSPLLQKRSKVTTGSGSFDYGWPLALGAAETPLTEMVQAYASIAGGGVYRPMVTILRVEDRTGNLLYAPDVGKGERQALDPRIAYQITSILSDSSARPTDYWRNQLTVNGYETAAKTGTSNKCLEWKDKNTCKLRKPDNAWILGFTPNLVAGVWSGNADSSALFDKGDGLNTSSALWKEFMERSHRLIPSPKTAFAVPPGIVQVQVSLLSGELPTACTPVELRRPDVFLEERPPTKEDPACASLVVDRVSGLLASPACPVEAQSSGSFLVPTSLLGDRWPSWEQGVQDWVKDQMVSWDSSPSHSGSLLPLPVAPTQRCDPSLTPGRLTKPTLQIMVPSENGTVTYPAFRPKFSATVGSTIREVRYSVDDKIIQVVMTEPFDPPLRIPRSIEKTGMHTFAMTVTDAFYNAVTQTVRFQFGEAKEGIDVQMTSPQNGQTFAKGSLVELRATVNDAAGTLKYIQFYLDSVLLTTRPREPFELSYALSVLPGTYRIRTVATDLSGKTTEDVVTIEVQ